jgi:hypothetical protein
MKTILAATALLALIACENVPVAANAECDRHNLTAEEHADCVAKLKSSEKELRKAD